MVELLLRSGVEPFGKKELLKAEVGCKKTKKKDLTCFISSITNNGFPNIIEFTSEDALEISLLLNNFYIIPYGKKLSQAGSIECLVPKNSLDRKRVCKVLDVDIFRNEI